jgi:hypothetical protein
MNLSKTTAVVASILMIGGVLVVNQSCSKKSSSTPPAMTLYDSLGGTAKVADPANPGQTIEKGYLGIRTVVDSAIFIIAADTAINGYFQVLISEVTSGNTSGYQKLSKNLSDFVAVATGAKDYTYSGLNMHDAHNHSGNPRITGTVASDDFDEFVKDVAASATKNGLPDYLIARLGALLYTVESQVVQR